MFIYYSFRLFFFCYQSGVQVPASLFLVSVGWVSRSVLCPLGILLNCSGSEQVNCFILTTIEEVSYFFTSFQLIKAIIAACGAVSRGSLSSFSMQPVVQLLFSHVPIGHLYIFFKGVSVQVFACFSVGSFVFLLLSCEIPCIFWMLAPIRYRLQTYFSFFFLSFFIIALLWRRLGFGGIWVSENSLKKVMHIYWFF